MKPGVLSILMIILGITAAHAGIYESPFGFSVDLPSHWTIVNREKLKSDPALEGRLKDSDRVLLDTNHRALQEGTAEIYFDNLHDSIFVQTGRGGMKPYKAAEKQICDTDLLQKAFSRTFGRSVSVYACKVVRVSSYDAIYMDFDGAKPGSRSLQYQIWKSSNDTVILTLTTRNESLKKLRDEFTAIIYSFEVIK